MSESNEKQSLEDILSTNPVINNPDKKDNFDKTINQNTDNSGFFRGFFWGTLSLFTGGALITQGAPLPLLIVCFIVALFSINSLKSCLGALAGMILAIVLVVVLFINLMKGM